MTSQFPQFFDTHLSRRCSCCLDGRPPSFLDQKALLYFSAVEVTAAFVAFVAVGAAAEAGGSAVVAVAVGRPWPAALAK